MFVLLYHPDQYLSSWVETALSAHHALTTLKFNITKEAVNDQKGFIYLIKECILLRKADRIIPRQDPKHIFHSNEPPLTAHVLIMKLHLKKCPAQSDPILASLRQVTP